MKKVKNLTVAEYLDKRGSHSYGKQIRLLDYKTHENKGSWFANMTAEVKKTKITNKFLFIFI